MNLPPIIVPSFPEVHLKEIVLRTIDGQLFVDYDSFRCLMNGKKIIVDDCINMIGVEGANENNFWSLLQVNPWDIVIGSNQGFKDEPTS